MAKSWLRPGRLYSLGVPRPSIETRISAPSGVVLPKLPIHIDLPSRDMRACVHVETMVPLRSYAHTTSPSRSKVNAQPLTVGSLKPEPIAYPVHTVVNPPPAYRAPGLMSVIVCTGIPFGKNPVVTVATSLT
jgi:hypothetical protein